MNKYLNLTIKAEKMKMPGKIKCFQDGHCFCECNIIGTVYINKEIVLFTYVIHVKLTRVKYEQFWCIMKFRVIAILN